MVVVDRCDIICTPTSVFRQGTDLGLSILQIGFYLQVMLEHSLISGSRGGGIERWKFCLVWNWCERIFFSQTVAQRLTMILLNRQVVNRINEHRIGWQSKIFKICKYTRKKALFEQISERILVICFTNNIRNSMKRIFLHST